jgi:hypothetical protein
VFTSPHRAFPQFHSYISAAGSAAIEAVF